MGDEGGPVRGLRRANEHRRFISACSATPETEARIKKSMALGESLDVNSTPSVFINGRMVPAIANIPYEQLKALVQFEIDHAGK